MLSIGRQVAFALLHNWCKLRFNFAAFGKGSVIKPFARTISGAKYVKIGRDCYFGEQLTLVAADTVNGARYSPTCRIGNRCAIGAGAFISCTYSIVIEDDVMASANVFIGDSYHGYEDPELPVRDQPMRGQAAIVIGQGSFLGYSATILPGVTLGKHCYVGANSVVTKSFGPYTVLVGSPAKAIRRYDVASGEWESVD
jgi:acetyltransferase-like isoleucine patch superfamily enzyme